LDRTPEPFPQDFSKFFNAIVARPEMFEFFVGEWPLVYVGDFA
jgi:hypothetical protein